jgi:hypothetical protein
LLTLASFFENAQVALNLGLLFSTAQVAYQFWQSRGWATFWAIFSQTHLVTLSRNQESAFWIVEKLKHLKGVSTANAAQSIW